MSYFGEFWNNVFNFGMTYCSRCDVYTDHPENHRHLTKSILKEQRSISKNKDNKKEYVCSNCDSEIKTLTNIGKLCPICRCNYNEKIS